MYKVGWFEIPRLSVVNELRESEFDVEIVVFDDNSKIDNEKLMAFEGNIRVVEAHACGTSQRIILYHVCCSKTYNVWKSSNLSMHGLNLTIFKSTGCGSRLI